MKRNSPVLMLVLAATLFGAGIIYLFLLRFEAGDVYPPYSSLRADPLGTMALAESLAKLPGMEMRRDTTDRNQLPDAGNATYLHLAAHPAEWQELPDEVFDEIEQFTLRGGRLVITLRPIVGWDLWSGSPPPPPAPIVTTNTATTNTPATGPRRLAKKKSNPTPAVRQRNSLAKRWGVEMGREELEAGNHGVYRPVQVINRSTEALPDTIDWHSSVVLTNLSAPWRVIYARGEYAVVAERTFGRGSVVLATDSYFLSNQAMWEKREPRLLAWLIGPTRLVVFDEAHLGVVESPGVAGLMRKYHLSGLVGGLILLAGLFVWKNSFSLVPPYAGEVRSPYIPGKDSTVGFINLLRRNIPSRDVLEVCFEQWTRSLFNRGNYRIAAVDHAQTIMERERAQPPASRNPVRAYREISTALKNPRFTPPPPETPHSPETK